MPAETSRRVPRVSDRGSPRVYITPSGLRSSPPRRSQQTRQTAHGRGRAGVAHVDDLQTARTAGNKGRVAHIDDLEAAVLIEEVEGLAAPLPDVGFFNSRLTYTFKRAQAIQNNIIFRNRKVII